MSAEAGQAAGQAQAPARPPAAHQGQENRQEPRESRDTDKDKGEKKDAWKEGGKDGGRDGKDGKDAGDGGPAAKDGDDDRAEREQRQGERFREAMRDPLADDGTPGAARALNRARREARASYHNVRGDSIILDRGRFGHAHIGDVYIGAARSASVPVFGDVPEDELRRLRQVYRAPAEYQSLKDVLRTRHVLVLGGPPGSGRLTTGLCLLDELATTALKAQKSTEGAPEEGPEAPAGRLRRLDVSALTHLTGDLPALLGGVPRGGGLLLQVPEAAGDWPVPQELHLDALSAALAPRDAYAVLVVTPSSPAGALLTGRYGRHCPPAPARELLSWHLVRGLADGADDGAEAAGGGTRALDRGDRILDHPLFRQALGLRLDALRPAETELVAGLVVRHLGGELTRERLLDACGDVARRQAREWFTGATAVGAEGDEHSGGAVDARLREAAFRIALAVLDGEAFSAVADAADLLAWEFLTAREPERAYGRPVFEENLEGLLAACRADLGEAEDESVGGVPLPVRTVRYRGEALAGAVLAEVWHSHHAARAPIVRWLRALADDPRPAVWTRAAVAAGELCTADVGYGFAELILPTAVADTPRRRFFSATALDQAGSREPYRRAVGAVVRDWADGPEEGLRWTAALVLGYGRTERETRTAVELLGRIGTEDEGEHLQVASYALTRLAAGSRAAEVLTCLREWVAEVAGEYLELALLSAVRLAAARTDEFWEPERPYEDEDEDEGQGRGRGRGRGQGDDGEPGTAVVPAAAAAGGRLPAASLRGGRGGGYDPWQTPAAARPQVPRASTEVTDAELGRRARWPLALALAVGVPDASVPLAELLWRTLDSHLAGEAATDCLADWLRAAERDETGEVLRALVWFLPQLVRGQRDWQRLEWLLQTMAAAPEEPMTAGFGQRVLREVGDGLRGRRRDDWA